MLWIHCRLYLRIASSWSFLVLASESIDCIIDNASATQIYALAADSVTGPTASTVEVVRDIVQRPETIRCLSTQGLAALMG